MSKKVVLGFSGGLDTTFCVLWLREQGYEPICVCLDVGQSLNLEEVKDSASKLKVEDLKIIDGKKNFADLFLLPALKANALYEGVYPLATALTRPYVGKILVEVAKEVGTNIIAHGCTGKGNDQVRIEMAVRALLPEAEIIDPIRDEDLSRDYEIEYITERGIDIGITEEKPYSIDQNIWGRSVCAGVLEDPNIAPPEHVFEWTKSLEDAPNDPEIVEIEFEKGVPISINGKAMDFLNLIYKANEIAGKHGYGRIDHIENRLVGLKSREIYEAPGALLLIKAHQVLESLVQTKSTLEFKKHVEDEYARLVYLGDWFSSHHMDLLAYLKNNQQRVTGKVRLKLIKGNCLVDGRESPNTLYDKALITYGKDSEFDQRSGAAFCKFLGMESHVQSSAQLLNFEKSVKQLVSSDD